MLSAEGNDSNHYPVLLIVDDAVTKCLPPAVFANEAGSYLAHKMDASLVFFMTAPYGFPNVNWALGDPVNPSFMPR